MSNQLFTFGPHKNVEPIRKCRMVPLWGDILHHEGHGHDYICEYDPDRPKDERFELGNANQWTPIMVIGDVPKIEYDIDKIEPVGFLSDSMVLWKIKE